MEGNIFWELEWSRTKRQQSPWPVIKALSDRVVLVKLHAQPFNLSIIQAYAPTSTTSDAELEKFYLALDQAKETVQEQRNHCGYGRFEC